MTKRQVKRMYKEICTKIENYYNTIKEDREKLDILSY